MRQFEFICGGVDAPAAEADITRIQMDVQGNRTVNLRIADISRLMVGNIPDHLLDVLEVAAYIYCGDQRATRGSVTLAKAGSEWRRGMRFIIPVRCPQIWAGAQLNEELQQTLGFLSDDTYEFEFRPATKPVFEEARYFENLSDNMFIPDEVALFSGGLDSFAGALDTIVGEGRKTVLVGHHSAPKVFAIQKELVTALKAAGHGDRLFYVPVNVTNTNVDPVEPTQRSRSFLFASIAFVIAQMFKVDQFSFYENGVVSLNLPIAGDVLGSRATKTTHPKVMRGFERIFALLVSKSIVIQTPFLWQTKKEIIERIVDHGFGHLLPHTVSCVHPMLWTSDVRHCGHCSQCIDRRFAILAADAEKFEPTEGYGTDLLLGPRDPENQIQLAVSYVRFNQKIMNSTRQQFPVENPDVYSCVSNVPGLSPAKTLDEVWAVHRRHADAVTSVIKAAVSKYASSLVDHVLPRGALLALCLNRHRIEAPLLADPLDQLSTFIDRLQQSVCEFAVDDAKKRIVFHGDLILEGANFNLFDALLTGFRKAKSANGDVPYVATWKLAELLKVSEESVRKQVVRIRDDTTERLAVEQGIVLGDDGIIENLRPAGYRIAPALREVFLGDLDAQARPMSQSSS